MAPTSSSRVLALLLLACVVLLHCATPEARPRPPHRRPANPFHNEDPGPGPALDQQAAASGGHHGRVQIKVYRGPDHDHHAPYGYWVKQPADDGPHH